MTLRPLLSRDQVMYPTHPLSRVTPTENYKGRTLTGQDPEIVTSKLHRALQ